VHPWRNKRDNKVMRLNKLLKLIRILNIEEGSGERVGAKST
jgi:hypothetical protein